MIQIITIIIGIIAGFFIWKLYQKSNQLQELQGELKSSNSLLKSLRVKFGKSFEHFAPFTKIFPGDKDNAVFMGMPIDYISFDLDTIKFIEIKTGNAQLSPKQKRIKKQIENGEVEFKEVRYNDKDSDN